MKFTKLIITQINIMVWISMVCTSNFTSNNDSVSKSNFENKNIDKIQSTVGIEESLTKKEKCPSMNW